MSEPKPRGRRRQRPAAKQRRIRERLSTYRAGRTRPQIPKVAFPSSFTLLNLFCGFLAIVQSVEGRYDLACWLIVLAGFFDVLDGMVARITGAQSAFGVELDSLSDIVSFGVAPGLLVYMFGLRAFDMLGVIVAALPAVCGAVRLARFNVSFTGEKQDYFTGLPIPGQAAAIVALILNVNDPTIFSQYSPSNLSMLMPVVFVLSFLMVSTIRFDAVPKPTASYIRAHPRKSAAFGIALLLIVFTQQVGLLIVLTAYLLHGIVRAVVRLIRVVRVAEPEA